MKFNFFFTFLTLTSILLFSACKGNTSSPELSGGARKTFLDSLHHSPQVSNGKTYRMRILSQPDIIESGKQVLFSLTPQIVGNETEPVALDNTQGYEINLVLVSSDLSWLDHRVPGLSDLGTYEQAYTFNRGGIYLMYAEYQPTGGRDTVQMKNIGVNGSAVVAKIYSAPNQTSIVGGFNVSISPAQGGQFETGKTQTIHAAILKGGVPVDPNTLGDYLGSKAHMVIIGVKDKNFLQVHPSVENGNLVFHTIFSVPGFYRAWLQFQNENIVQTADFVIQVE